MSTPARLTGYLAILAVALLGAFGIGNAVGPIGGGAQQDSYHQEGHGMTNNPHAEDDGGHSY